MLYHNYKPWLVDRGSLNVVTIKFLVRGQTATGQTHLFLAVTHNGVTYSQQEDVSLPANADVVASNMKIKRVIALTQRGTESQPAFLDGSFSTGASFHDGYIEKIFASSTNTLIGDGLWQNWNEAGGDGTHFYPAGHCAEPVGTTSYNYAPEKPWVIDLRSPHQRNSTSLAPILGLGQATNPSTLFSSETVDIKMFKKVPVKAKKSRNGKGSG